MLKDRLRNLALASGFDAVGFARAEPVDQETAQHFREWIATDHQASMAYMKENIEKRLDPSLLLSEAKTVIVLLSNYHRPNPTETLEAGKIARYAGGRDYHKIIRKGLKDLRRKIEDDFPDSKNWFAVDTSPILERYWAERAGVGWVGKNTMLINRGLGTWTFIGILLTSLDILPDQPHADHCGSCTKCLEACPTQAFPGPGVLDSNRCVSYWTIEHRGDFPENVDLHGWFFGCDDCQTACPWNRFAKPTGEPDYDLRKPFGSSDLVRWAEITRGEWDEITRGTAIRRAGYEGFRRNARVL